MATLTTADQLFAAPPKRRYKTVTVPVSGFTLRIQSLTEKDYSDYQACFLDKQGKPIASRLRQANRIFISMCVVDEDGNRIITGESVDKIATWDAADANYLYNECSRFAGISTTDIDELVKNYEETPES
jgi:hypothetical protein